MKSPPSHRERSRAGNGQSRARRIGLQVAGLVVLALPTACAAAGIIERSLAATGARVAIIFVVLMLAFRLLGKRELNSVSPFELVTLMLIPEVLSNALQQEGALLNGLVGLSTLLLMVLATSILSYSVPGFSRVVESEPTVLVAHGKVCKRALDDERIQVEELLGEMREHGFAALEQVRWAILESSGTISFIPFEMPPGPLPVQLDSSRTLDA